MFTRAVNKLIYKHGFRSGDFLAKNAPPLARMRHYVKILKYSGHFEASKGRHEPALRAVQVSLFFGASLHL